MRLLKLSSSNSKFRTVNFESGLNIIVGTQLSEEQKKSINGIGKSMSLTLVHHLFGSEFKTASQKKLHAFLAKYGEFSLSVEHGGTVYDIRKNFSQNEFYINQEEVKKTNYSKRLNEIFLSDTNAKPSFKQVFNCFARKFSSEASYYSNIITQQARPLEDFEQRYTNLALLGVDLDLVQQSSKNKDKLNKLSKAKSTIEAYQQALDNSNINDIKDEIERLTSELNNFIIAENFNKVKTEADTLTSSLNELRNQHYFLKEKLDRKKNSISNSENINIDIKKVTDIFHEANFFFPDKVVVRLEEAQKFHETLIYNRKKRLASEIEELKLELERLELEKEKISSKRDALIKSLKHTGALEERDSLKDRITILTDEVKDLEKYENILTGFKSDKSILELEHATIKNKSIEYLSHNKDTFAEIAKQFRSLVKNFYDNKGGSFVIKETQDAKYLFNIDTHIPKEGSQGVGEVKIFCYDILLYLLNKDLLGFVAHDGCIFSEMDPRQKSTIFKVVLGLLKDHDFQYFVNIGDNSLKEILDDKNEILTREEKETVRNSIRLSLYDNEPKDWLFGVSFD